MEIHSSQEIIAVLKYHLDELTKALDKNDLMDMETEWFSIRVGYEQLAMQIKHTIKFHPDNKPDKTKEFCDEVGVRRR